MRSQIVIYGQQLQLGYDTLVCMQPLAQEFPKPLIARSSEDAFMRRLPLPIPCSCLVDPVGSSTPFCTKQEHTAPPSCFSSLSGWEPWAPLPNSAQVCCFTFGYCKWNPPLLNPEITADLPWGESPAWKMRNSLGAETLDKDTRSGYVPWPYEASFLRNIAWVKVLHLHFTSSSKNGESNTSNSCATAQGTCRELGTQTSAFTGCLVVSAVLDTGHLHLPSYCLLQCWNVWRILSHPN